MISQFKKINYILLATILIIILTLFLRQYFFAGIFFIYLIYLWNIWIKSLDEDLILYFLKRDAGFLTREEIIEQFFQETLSRMGKEEYRKTDQKETRETLSKSVPAALKRLERKKIIEIKGEAVYLIKKDYKIAFKTE